MPSWSVKKHVLSPPPLSELSTVINDGLKHAFSSVEVSVAACPDLRLPPFNLASEGLTGSERIADIGGPPNLHPFPKFDRIYSFLEMTKMMEMGEDKGFIIGAGAGPFKLLGVNSELMPNMSYEQDGNGVKVTNLTRFAKVDDSAAGGVVCERIPDDDGSTDCGLMANLFGSEGQSGDVIKIVAKGRTGQKNFTDAIQHALKDRYGDQTVSLGGVFVIRKGRAKLHVMPDFSREPLGMGDVGKWLRFYDMDAPLICLSVFHSHDIPGWNLRMEHTHCFSNHGQGGHYHFDVTPDDVEYEAYLNTARYLYRIDQPEGTH
ncbi:hypothetical protein F5884DRAFT_790110 [Xylogone sp. PMI_703]|nr:hypothetical protein F5884DRAFT_790110 [Xylogone sp. PMI_703]